MIVPDYAQPDFFRFGWDQMLLVKTVHEHTPLEKLSALVELGIGSGVMSCELSKLREIQALHGVELQREEWENFLTPNLALHGRFERVQLHWQKVSEFNLDEAIKVPLIIANPPYFLPRAGRKSIDPRRNIAHRFVVDEPQDWVNAMVRTLAPGGSAWWLHRDPGPQGKPAMPANFEWQHVVRLGRMRVIRLTHLNVE
jgi:tRNA1(Val) A37 N6-methylase TrmN6